MERLDLGPVVAMRAEPFDYVRIDASGFMRPEQLAQCLSDGRLGHFLATSARNAAVLNAGGMSRFGTEDSEFIGQHWAPLLASVKITKLSLVVPEQVFALFGQVFQVAGDHAKKHGVEIRCFPSRQFTDTWESVTWFKEEKREQLFEAPIFIDRARWAAARVMGVAFLLPESGLNGLGIIFGEPAEGIAIFDGWRKALGPRDEDELLRVAIIEGPLQNKPPGYSLLIGADPEALAKKAAKGGGLSFDVTRAFETWGRRMDTKPEGSPHLQAFKADVQQKGQYALVPVLFDGTNIDPLYDKQIVKRKLVLRHTSQIAPNDPDAMIFG